jgi:hypothetical protein
MEAVHRAAKIDLFGDRPFNVNAGTIMSKPGVSLPTPMDLIMLGAGRRQGLKQLVAPGQNQ